MVQERECWGCEGETIPSTRENSDPYFLDALLDPDKKVAVSTSVLSTPNRKALESTMCTSSFFSLTEAVMAGPLAGIR